MVEQNVYGLKAAATCGFPG